jgi:hypothetical protein
MISAHRGLIIASGFDESTPYEYIMHPMLKKIIEGLVGIIVILMFLRLLLLPTYAFMRSGNGAFMIPLMIFEGVLSGFIAYRVVRYLHRYL